MADILLVEGLVQVLHASVSAILLANGGLLALTSLRNGHLSDRARGNVDEALYKLPNTTILTQPHKVARINVLINQNKAFMFRYRITSLAFVFAILSFLFFGPPATIGYNARHPAVVYICGISGIAAISFFGIALLLLIVEFLQGNRTLKNNNKVLSDIILDFTAKEVGVSKENRAGT